LSKLACAMPSLNKRTWKNVEKIISQKGQDVNVETMRILEDAIKLLESKEP